MKAIQRRHVLKMIYGVPFLGVFACNGKVPSIPEISIENLTLNPEAWKLSFTMRKDQVHSMLEQRVEMMMQKTHHCAQSAFYALSEQFGLGGNEVLKALTPLPGLGETGSTCGAMTGCLMAMGLVFGRDQIDDWDAYRSALKPSNSFCRSFVQELGSDQCCQIQQKYFGDQYDLMEPTELRRFQRDGATEKCTQVVQKACCIASDMIIAHSV